MIVNLTPHDINIYLPNGEVLSIASAGTVRVTEEVTPAGNRFGVPIVGKSFGRAVGLPEPEKGTIYVVSQIVRDACPGRSDLASPHDLVRDEAGRIIGCRGLAM